MTKANQKQSEPYETRATAWLGSTPGDYGIDLEQLQGHQKACWERQQRYLEHYAECKVGTIAADRAGVSFHTAERWVKANTLEFKARRLEATQRFNDRLEVFAWERVQRQGDNVSPILLITLLNANIGNKYRPAAQMNDEQAKETMQMLRKYIRGGGKKAKGEEAEIEEMTPSV
jgi:hypothetical protein